MVQETQVVAVPMRSRYELKLGDRTIGYVDAVPRGDCFLLPYVFVEPEFRNQGNAERMMKAVLEDVRARGRRVVPICPYAVAYIRRHKEFADLVYIAEAC